jgi:hypothetical protein
MTDKKQDLIDQKLQDLNNDGIDRGGFLKCMAWAGTGLVWSMSGGIPVSRAFGGQDQWAAKPAGVFCCTRATLAPLETGTIRHRGPGNQEELQWPAAMSWSWSDDEPPHNRDWPGRSGEPKEWDRNTL